MSTQSNNPNRDMIAHYMLGGAGIGIGGGLLTSLINHFKTLNSKAEKAEDTTADDDILYVNLKRRPDAKQAAIGTRAVAMAGGLITLPMAYAMVRKQYQAQKRKALQAELDEAQNAYLESMVPETKQAAFGNTLDHLLESPAALSLLLIASSGVLADRVLDKNFPAPKAPASLRPRRLVLRDEPPQTEDPAVVAEKQANEADAAEGMLALVLANKEAADKSGLGDLIKAAAAGRTQEILHASDEGPETLFSVVKSAGVDEPMTALQRDLATGWLVREPELAPLVKLAAAIEFVEAYPMAMVLARQATQEQADGLLKLAALYRQCYRAEQHANSALPNVKSAYGLEDVLAQALQGVKPEAPEQKLTSGESSDSNESTTKVEAQGPVAKKLLAKNRDVIDEVLTPGPSQAPAV
jgi:hypothetical protein